jgi:hypothetical protein
MFQDWERRILSKPTPVHWAGFESNTFRLQQAGWDFSAEQDFASMRTRILMRHKAMHFYGSSGMVDTDFFQGQGSEGWRNIRFPIQWITGGGVQVMRVMDNFENFRPVDMQPQVQSRNEIKDIEDMGLFATASLARTNEIIVDPDSVADMLARINDLQDPERKEHFAKMAEEARRGGGDRSNYRPRQNFHAQIISLVA